MPLLPQGGRRKRRRRRDFLSRKNRDAVALLADESGCRTVQIVVIAVSAVPTGGAANIWAFTNETRAVVSGRFDIKTVILAGLHRPRWAERRECWSRPHLHRAVV